MFRRLWQSSMITLARWNTLKATLQGSRATSALSVRYVAGRSAEAAIDRAAALLDRHQIRSSLYVFGRIRRYA